MVIGPRAHEPELHCRSALDLSRDIPFQGVQGDGLPLLPDLEGGRLCHPWPQRLLARDELRHDPWGLAPAEGEESQSPQPAEAPTRGTLEEDLKCGSEDPRPVGAKGEPVKDTRRAVAAALPLLH